MKSWIRQAGLAIAAFSLAVVVGRSAEAQGVTSAAIVGTITEAGGSAVSGAELTLTKPATGETHVVTARSDGRYVVDNASAGGPYTLAVRAIGFEPVTVQGLQLILGQRLSRDVQLTRATVQLEAVTIRSPLPGLADVSRPAGGDAAREIMEQLDRLSPGRPDQNAKKRVK